MHTSNSWDHRIKYHGTYNNSKHRNRCKYSIRTDLFKLCKQNKKGAREMDVSKIKMANNINGFKHQYP